MELLFFALTVNPYGVPGTNCANHEVYITTKMSSLPVYKVVDVHNYSIHMHTTLLRL